MSSNIIRQPGLRRLGFGLPAAALVAASIPGLAVGGNHGGAKDIVDTAVDAGSFTTLAAALTAADLVGALKGSGPFTVFAPTDAAFGKLPEGTLDELLQPENEERLKSILLYHVVPGKVMAADVAGGAEPETLQGGTLEVRGGDGVTVNGAKVTSADIEASNGVIHVIDSVLLPRQE